MTPTYEVCELKYGDGQPMNRFCLCEVKDGYAVALCLHAHATMSEAEHCLRAIEQLSPGASVSLPTLVSVDDPLIRKAVRDDGETATLMQTFGSLPKPERTREERLERALTLAVMMLSKHEPGDSRAVSDEFVALACVQCGVDDDDTMAVIDRGIDSWG